MEILVVDDSEELRLMLVDLFTSFIPNSKVVTAVSGEECLELIHSGYRPDIIILDIILPALNGFEVCRVLKNDVDAVDIPIVLITGGTTSEQDRLDGLNAGADAFLMKPLNPTDLLLQINTIIKFKELDNILNSISDGLFVLNDKMLITYINKAAEKLLNVTRIEAMNNNIFSVFKELGDVNFTSYFKKVITNQVSTVFQLTYSDGITYKVRVHPYANGVSLFFNKLEKEELLVEDLEKTKSLLYTAVDQSNVGIIFVEAPSCHITYINDAAINLVGEPKDKLLCQIANYVDVWHLKNLDNSNIDATDVPLYKSLIYGEEAQADIRITNKGCDYIVHFTSTPIINNNNEITGAVAALIDITEQKINEERVEALLALAEKKFFNESEIISYALEDAVRLTYSEFGFFHFVDEVLFENRAEPTIKITQWSKEVYNQCNLTLLSKLDSYPLAAAGVWTDCIRLKGPVIYNDYQKLKDKKGMPEGHIKIDKYLGVPVFNSNGKVVAIAGVANKKSDYTNYDAKQLMLFMTSLFSLVQRFRVEEALKKEKEQFKIYLDVATSLFLVLDSAGSIQLINKRGCNIMGCTLPEDIIGKNWIENFIPDYEKERVSEEFEKLIAGEKTTDLFENDIYDFYGNIKTIRWQNAVLLDEQGDIYLILSSGEDLTEQRALEKKQLQYWDTVEELLKKNMVDIAKIKEKREQFSGETSEILDNMLGNLSKRGE